MEDRIAVGVHEIYLVDLEDDITRTGLMLCMWTGCQDGSKTISSHTSNGIHVGNYEKAIAYYDRVLNYLVS